MKLLRGEITKLLFQKRTYVGWVGLLAIPILIVVALDLSSPSSRGGDGGPGGLFILASHTGLLVPLAAIGALTTFLLPLLASMAGSFQLAGEAESGTIKTWLVHPVSRGGVLLSKWAVAVLYLLAGLALVAASGYVAGVAVFGAHAPALLSGDAALHVHQFEPHGGHRHLGHLYRDAGLGQLQLLRFPQAVPVHESSRRLAEPLPADDRLGPPREGAALLW